MNSSKKSVVDINKNSIKLKSIIEEKEIQDLRKFIDDKNLYIQDIIRNTIISIKKNKHYEIFSNNDTTLSITVLNELYEKTQEIKDCISNLSIDSNKIIDMLQKIIDKLSMIICGFGTSNIDDLLFISLGSEYTKIKTENEYIKDKYELIKKYIHPIGYKIIHWKQNKKNMDKNVSLCSNKITDTVSYIEDANMFECFDVESNIKLFYQKIYGIRVVIQNEAMRKTLIINGIIDDVPLECFNNSYIEKRKEDLYKSANQIISSNERDIMNRIIETLTFKEILVYGDNDIYKKMFMVFSDINMIKNNKLDITFKRFLEMDTYNQRNLLIHLLLYKEDEIQYICYLLYDLISVNSSDNIDTTEQVMITDSLPWKIKSFFKDAIKYTIKYTNDMAQKYDINRVTLEQQIYLMKANEHVKEKAMLKLKEIKGKPDEMGMKTKQYLEGLIKIPFGIYREEPILRNMKEMNVTFLKIVNNCENIIGLDSMIKKEKYTNVEMLKYLKIFKEKIMIHVIDEIKQNLKNQNTKQITNMLQFINNKQEEKLVLSKLSKPKKLDTILHFISNKENQENIVQIYDFIKTDSFISLSKTVSDMNLLSTNIHTIENTMKTIVEILDESIYGHKHAKNQILKIISQWINGEQSGYSFGFEGSPGVGKTSLAKKGLANCLKNEHGISRPFSFIALGGSCNGSTLEGHGYTYMNSTWGRIVDILMESKCMNPIIYIDELDKVSKTENGKEIIGILTHLIDQTQNDTFQDKYFSGIDIDLSKALFIFSYNDPEQIDRILLDRIHRIKFDNLSVDEKIVIVKKYILPEINKKMGFHDVIQLSDDMIEFIIHHYTLEPGVRKLKEILFDLYGEINIELLHCNNSEIISLPIIISEPLLENKYLKKYHKINEKKIHLHPEVGIINGLWANALGRGGIIPIQTMFFPSTTFLDLKLTGLQGDVMKESMNVAKTFAWNITPLEKKKEILSFFEETKCQGLHIHCPEGSVSKDGPSAGCAITTAIYSLLNKKPIKNNIAITGEINLQGEVTAIGGLDLKILGGIRAGVTTFLYPKENHHDFLKFMDTYKEKAYLEKIVFIELSTIHDVFEHVFE